MLKKIAGAVWRKMPSAVRMKIVRLTQSQFTVSVAAIVVNDSGEVLLLDHVLRPASGWGIPGGFIARGEQPAEAVQRELREETGVELENIKLVSARTISRHIEILFLASAKGVAAVNSREIIALAWFDIDEMPEKMDRVQKALIKKYLSNPNDN